MTQTLQMDRLLDAALELALRQGWEALDLKQVAQHMNVSLTTVYALIQQKDDLAEALFDRADKTMLSLCDQEGFHSSSQHEQLQQLILCWLESLAPYRKLIKEMLAYKLELGHLHLQVLGLMRISRTVQWMLHASGYQKTGLRRIMDEVTLTRIYLTNFSYWLLVNPDQAKMKSRLQNQLHSLS